ncbi:hypothetical protein [Enterococcus rotai]|uniref:hypothetical protein n=1 Tax=Enterococcus rotai TaxID=118060 RepID=UPI0032B40033
MSAINGLSKEMEMQRTIDVAIELNANPKLLENNQLEIMPRCGYDLETLQVLGKQGNIDIVVNDIYLQELEESKKALDQFCSILNIAEVSHDVIGINKNVLKYRLVVFPTSEAMENMLKKDAEKVDNVEFIFESGAIRAMDEQGELEDDSERGRRLRQKEEVCKILKRWGVDYQISDLETVEVFPFGYQEKLNIQKQLGSYTLLNFIFKTDKYTKIPMTGSEKREIIKDLATKFKKYGNGFLEMKNSYTIVAYAKSSKLAETYYKIFSDYWYRYVEVDGDVKALKLIVEPLYKDGEMFAKEEWLQVVNKAKEASEGLASVKIELSNEGQLVIQAPKFESVKSLYWVKNYHDRKLESDNEKGFVFTEVVFKLEN